MDSKPQRVSRIRDENNQAHVRVANKGRQAGASKAAGQKVNQPAKRAPLGVAATHINANTVTVNVSDGNGKDGINKPAVRGRALATQTTASIAPTRGAHQPLGARTNGVSKKPMIYRDEPAQSQPASVKDAGPRHEAVAVAQPPMRVVDDDVMENVISSDPQEEDRGDSSVESVDPDNESFHHENDQVEPTNTTQTGFAQIRLFPQTNDDIETEIRAAHKKWAGQVDEEEEGDPLMVREYLGEIFEHCHILDHQYLAEPRYMDNQPELEWNMRSVLIDWIVQVHDRFRMVPETLFLTVNIIDRFLSRKTVALGKLQLVGITALFLAAKYEEVHFPSVEELVYMVDDAYTADEIRKAERFMLKVLSWEINAPGPLNFLRKISKADNYDYEIRTLSKFVIETTLMDERFIGAPMSYIAASSYYLSSYMLGKGDWTDAHIHYSGYTAEQLSDAVRVIVETLATPEHHAAVHEKYGTKKHKRVSSFVDRWVNEQWAGQ